jgi:hypothetical protein
MAPNLPTRTRLDAGVWTVVIAVLLLVVAALVLLML